MTKFAIFALLLVCGGLSGCATSKLEKTLANDKSKIADFSASSAAVTLRNPSDKYARFRTRLEQAMMERYVKKGVKPVSDQIVYFIDMVHFDHKGASFATGGASGGNWVEGRLMVMIKGVPVEKKISERFNTGGGYTILQDWEDRMIKALLVDMDAVVQEMKNQK